MGSGASKNKSEENCQLTGYAKFDAESDDYKENKKGKPSPDLNMNVEDTMSKTSADQYEESKANISNDLSEVSFKNAISPEIGTKSSEMVRHEANIEDNGTANQKGEIKCSGSSINLSGTSSVTNSSCSHANPARTIAGSDFSGEATSDEKKNMIEKTPVSNIDKEEQENSSGISTANGSGQVPTSQSGEMSSVDAVTHDSAHNDSTGETDNNESCINENSTSAEQKPNVLGDKSSIPTLNATSDDTEQTAPANKNGNKQTSVDRMDEEQTEENDKKKLETSKTESEEEALKDLPSDNLLFYQNKIYSRPFPGEKIEEMLKWKGDYLRLERTHSYIQWLFPIPDSRGMNYSAQPLQEHEAKIISEDETLRAQVLEAYKMMLDFYGMKLVDDSTGEVQQGDNWEERYEHLDRSIHNRFRITRILKALGELGFEYLQKPWLEFIIHEATLNKNLPGLNGSSMDHWIGAIKDEATQGTLYSLLSDLNEQLHARQYSGNQHKREGNHARTNDDASNGDDVVNGIVNQNADDNNGDRDNRSNTEGSATDGKTNEANSFTGTVEGNSDGINRQCKEENDEQGKKEEPELSDTVPKTSDIAGQTKQENVIKSSEENKINGNVDTLYGSNETKEGEAASHASGKELFNKDSLSKGVVDKEGEMGDSKSDQDADEHENKNNVKKADGQKVIGETLEGKKGQAVTNEKVDHNFEIWTDDKNGNVDKNEKVDESKPRDTAEKNTGCGNTQYVSSV